MGTARLASSLWLLSGLTERPAKPAPHTAMAGEALPVPRQLPAPGSHPRMRTSVGPIVGPSPTLDGHLQHNISIWTQIPSALLPLPGHCLWRFETAGSRGRAWVATGPTPALRSPCPAPGPSPQGAGHSQGLALRCASCPHQVSVPVPGRASSLDVGPPSPVSRDPGTAGSGREEAPWTHTWGFFLALSHSV